MDVVYFYELNKDSQVKKILSTDKFMRLSFTTKIGGHNDKVGYHIYIIGNCEEINLLNSEFKILGLIKISGEAEEKIISKFKSEAENAACGMGMIFG